VPLQALKYGPNQETQNCAAACGKVTLRAVYRIGACFAKQNACHGNYVSERRLLRARNASLVWSFRKLA
jgi:hypothetical protein